MKAILNIKYINSILRVVFFFIMLFNYFLFYNLHLINRASLIIVLLQFSLNFSALYFLVYIEILKLKINHIEGTAIYEIEEKVGGKVRYKIKRWYSEPKIAYLLLFVFFNLYVFQFLIISDFEIILLVYNVICLYFLLSNYYDFILIRIVDKIFKSDYNLNKIITENINNEAVNKLNEKLKFAIVLLIFGLIVFIKLLSMKGWI